MSKRFDSVIASPMKVFVRSPLGVRDTGGVGRALYMSANDWHHPGGVSKYDEKLFRLSLTDLRAPLFEARPPWWPAPDPVHNQAWVGGNISGDSQTVWYTAWNTTDIDVGVATINIYKLTSTFQIIDQWRWSAPAFGNGFMSTIVVFGTSNALWGLVKIYSERFSYLGLSNESYIVKLDPSTMEIIDSSRNLWAGLTQDQINRRNFFRGGGTADVIRLGVQQWLAPGEPDYFDQGPRPWEGLIKEYSPTDFSLVSTTNIPRDRDFGDWRKRRLLQVLGGDSESIWLGSSSMTDFGETRPGENTGAIRISELPPDFSDANRTIIQDEIIPLWPYPSGLG